MPSPATLRRAGQLRDRAGKAHGQAPLPWSRTAHRTALLLSSRLRLPCLEQLDFPEEYPAVHGLHVRDLQREGPLSGTKTKARRARGAHALPRRSALARPATFSKFTCIPGRAGGCPGSELPAPGRRARCGVRAVTGRPSGAGPGHNGSLRAGGPEGERGDSAGPASARPLIYRGQGAECGGGGWAQTHRAPGAC